MIKRLMAVVISISAFAQIEFSVQTDSDTYSVGDPIGITGSIYNSGQDLARLEWTSGCQFGYYISNWPSFYGQNWACTLQLTWIDLEPDSTHIWEYIHSPSDTTFPDGYYPVVGFLLDDEYRLTAPQIITIGDPSSPYLNTGTYPSTDSLFLTNGGCMGLSLTPEFEQLSNDIDLMWIRTDGYTYYQYPIFWWDSLHPQIQMSNEFYFFVRDSLEYSYELYFINGGLESRLNIGQENDVWADGDCTYRLVLLHEGSPVDTLDYNFTAEITMGIVGEPQIPSIDNFRAYPTPFNPMTTLSFQLTETSNVSFNVYDLKGCLVWSNNVGILLPGTHEQNWFGKNDQGEMIGSGIYLVQVVTETSFATAKVILLK